MSDGEADAESERTAETSQEDGRESGPKRWAKRFVWGAVALIAIIAVLPTIVSKTSLGRVALDRIAERLPKGSSIDAVSLSWLRPVRVAGVTLRDDAGFELEVDEIESGQPLMWMLLNQAAPDSLTLRGIDVAIDLDTVIADDGTLRVPNFGSRSTGEQPSKIPAIRIEDLRLALSNGPLLQPVEVGLSVVTVVPGKKNGEMLAKGVGELVAGESSAPLKTECEFSLDGQHGRYGLVVEELQAGAVVASLEDATFEASGTLAIRAVVEREEASRWNGKLTIDSPKVTLMPNSRPDIIVPANNLRAAIVAAIDSGTGEFQADSLSINSDLLTGNMTAEGRINGDEPFEVDARGRVELLGPAVALAGLPSHIEVSAVSFEAIEARIDAEGFAMTGAVRWPRAQAFQLDSDNGLVHYRLTPDALDIALTNVSLGSGQAVGQYRVDLAEQPPVLQFDGGPILQDVELAEDLCRNWLKYLSPMMANATDINGQFGLNANAFRIPIAQGNPIPAGVSGRLLIDKATMQPGRITRELLATVSDLGSLLQADRLVGRLGNAGDLELVRLPQQQVDFRVERNSVLHRGFKLETGKVVVRTSGEIGFQEQLDLVAEIAIEPSLYESRPILANVFRTPLGIPISGTVTAPRIDRSALTDVGRNAATGVVGGLLDRFLNRRGNDR